MGNGGNPGAEFAAMLKNHDVMIRGIYSLISGQSEEMRNIGRMMKRQEVVNERLERLLAGHERTLRLHWREIRSWKERH